MKTSNDYDESKESIGPGTIMVVGGGAATMNDFNSRKHLPERRRRQRSSLGTLTDDTLGISVTLDPEPNAKNDTIQSIKTN